MSEHLRLAAAEPASSPTSRATVDYWLSWYSPTSMAEFELHSPWWVSGYDMADRNVIVAAVRAVDEEAAFAQVRAAYDDGEGAIEERFIDLLTGSPFSGRFPRSAWMAWDDERTCGCPEHRPAEQEETRD